jgi:Na+-transporting NADH:ubiquinone oxidoreductase subunit B
VKFLEEFFAKQEKHFHKGGKLERLYPLFEATESFLFSPGKVTEHPSHVRDYIDLKRVMVMVIVALIPAIVMALYNTGYQANLAMQQLGLDTVSNWRGPIIEMLGVGYDPNSVVANMVHGALYFLPVYIVTLAVGGIFETLFAIVRKHEINEGFLVTSMLFPLILPPDIPLWQVAIGITFGVVIGKEVFGGTGMNILNPALTARAFLFFAYPAEISGDKVWVAVDGLSKATPLAEFADPNLGHASVQWIDAFLGFIPGSMGETSTLACLIGAVILIATGVGSWRIMLSMFLGMVAFSSFLNFVGSDTNPMFAMPWYWHLVVGGFAFGTVFMATDPVSASMTEKGKWYYGAMIGVLSVMVRVLNPAFPEGVMLAILFGNVFAPIIDRIVLNANIKRRELRSAN